MSARLREEESSQGARGALVPHIFLAFSIASSIEPT
jgi:hypothetical protein